jgi:hypothetical protein
MIYSILIVLHFVFDWMLQPRHIARAKGKTKSGISAVMTHTVLNIAPFSAVLLIVLWWYDYDIYALCLIVSANFFSHILIDIFLPKGRTERKIINWTAIDQILHLVILFTLITYVK